MLVGAELPNEGAVEIEMRDIAPVRDIAPGRDITVQTCIGPHNPPALTRAHNVVCCAGSREDAQPYESRVISGLMIAYDTMREVHIELSNRAGFNELPSTWSTRSCTFKLLCITTGCIYALIGFLIAFIVGGQVGCNVEPACNKKHWLQDTFAGSQPLPSPPPSAPEVHIEIEMQPPPNNDIETNIVIGEPITPENVETFDSSQWVKAIQCFYGLLCLLIVAWAVASGIYGREKFDAAMGSAFETYSSFA